MSTEFINDQWRLPNAWNGTESNVNKQSNYSMSFDGSSQYIDIGNDISVSGNCTVSFWFKVPTIPNSSGDVMFARYTGSSDTDFLIIGIYLQGVLASNNSSIAGSKTTRANLTLSVDTWYHCAVTKISGVVTNIYINGTDKAGPVNTYEWWSCGSTNSGFIGQKANSNNLFDGKIDGVAIFNYALSASQVATLWGGGTSVSNPMALPSSPIAYYPLGTSAFNGEYLAENNAIGDYVFDFIDGNNTFVDCNTNIIDFSGNDYTVSAWVKWDGTGDANQMIASVKSGGSNVDFVLSIQQSTGKIIYWNGSTQVFSNSTIPTNAWCMVTVIVKATQKDFFINGVADGTPSQTRVASAASGTSFLIGKSNFGNEYFNGFVSSVQVFNTVLSGPEVQTLYNYGSPIQTLANIPQSSNLKAWYKLDASEVYNNTTTEWEINNSIATELKAFAFDLKQGSSSTNNEKVVTYPNNELNGLSSITVTSWLYANDSITAYDGIYSNRSGSNYFLFHANTTTSTEYSVYVQGANSSTWAAASSTTIRKNTWNHIALVCESSSIKIYINGVDATSSSTNNFPGISQTIPFDIGSDGTSRNWDGLMSNFQVWNTNLSDSQVLSLYNNGKPIQTLNDIPQNSNLIGWWQLNDTATFDGTNWNIPDDSGNNNTGVSSNMTQDNLVDTNVSALNGLSSGMSQANLVQSDLQTVAPYSKYAMSFDGNDYIQGSTLNNYDDGDFSVSIWLYRESGAVYGRVIGNSTASSRKGFDIYTINNNVVFTRRTPTKQAATGNVNISYNTWHNIIGTYNDSTGDIKLYLDGVLKITASATSDNNANPSVELTMGTTATVPYSDFLNGKLSNASIWNTSLTSAQVTEIYNEGLPSNLNSHSAYSNLVSWWQLGENSSFASNWICADEKGSNNGESQNMGVDALTNGVGTTANGVSSGMSEGNLVGDAPYSTTNALSTNMVVTSRVTGSGNTP